MKRIGLIVAAVLLGSLGMIQGVYFNGSRSSIDSFEVAQESGIAVYLFPITSELQYQQNTIKEVWYVLLGNNKNNDSFLGVSRNTWSDFAINYEQFESLTSHLATIGRGVLHWVKQSVGLAKGSEGLKTSVTDNDLRALATQVLELFTNKVYTKYDLRSANFLGKQVDPIEIFVAQSGKGTQQRTNITIFVTVDVRVSIARLNHEVNNSYKNKFLWYPVGSLQEVVVPASIKVNQNTIELLKKYFKK